MFHARLLELESELLAKEQALCGLEQLTPECAIMIDQLQNEVGLKLGDKAAKDWKGWLSYKRGKEALVICRGRAFNLGGIFARWHAGFDVVNGADSARECQRGFDVTPAQELDHLQVNFGAGDSVRVFLWYGENIAPYRLIFAAEMIDEPEKQLQSAIVEACTWILTKPKGETLPEFLAKKQDVQA